MAKAVLELPEMPEMPESCWKCKYCTIFDVCSILSKRSKSDTYAIVPGEGRHKDCPLKLVEGCEYCTGENPPTLFENGETIIYYHPGHRRFLDGTYELNWKACPMCGRRLEVEP